MKITIIVFVIFLIIPILSALMSKPNSRVQKISLEIVKGLIVFAINRFILKNSKYIKQANDLMVIGFY